MQYEAVVKAGKKPDEIARDAHPMVAGRAVDSMGDKWDGQYVKPAARALGYDDEDVRAKGAAGAVGQRGPLFRQGPESVAPGRPPGNDSWPPLGESSVHLQTHAARRCCNLLRADHQHGNNEPLHGSTRRPQLSGANRVAERPTRLAL